LLVAGRLDKTIFRHIHDNRHSLSDRLQPVVSSCRIDVLCINSVPSGLNKFQGTVPRRMKLGGEIQIRYSTYLQQPSDCKHGTERMENLDIGNCDSSTTKQSNQEQMRTCVCYTIPLCTHHKSVRRGKHTMRGENPKKKPDEHDMKNLAIDDVLQTELKQKLDTLSYGLNDWLVLLPGESSCFERLPSGFGSSSFRSLRKHEFPSYDQIAPSNCPPFRVPDGHSSFGDPCLPVRVGARGYGYSNNLPVKPFNRNYVFLEQLLIPSKFNSRDQIVLDTGKAVVQHLLNYEYDILERSV